jgi:hypothetical protein
MLDYSELTVVKNTDGVATALGYPINSFLLQNNKALFAGGGKKKKISPSVTGPRATGPSVTGPIADDLDYEHLAVPAGLVCMTQTVCRPADDMAYANEMGANEMGANDMGANDIVPEGLYERLLALAEKKVPKKMTKRKQQQKHKKTHKTRK